MGEQKDELKRKILRRLIGSDLRELLVPTTDEERETPVTRDDLMKIVTHTIGALVEVMVTEKGEQHG